MTIGKARKLLGRKANHLTDEEVRIILNSMKMFAEVCYIKLLDNRSTLANQVE